MAEDDEQIAIDHEILLRSAETLRRTAESLVGVSQAIASAPLGANAFGLMNSWMLAPIAAVTSNSAEHVRASGNVVEIIGTATELAAHDFERTEEDVLLWITALDEQLGYSTAPPPPAPSAAQPVPTPTPQPSPTPPADGSTP